MEGTFLRFYAHENQRHHHVLLWEWLLRQANKLGVRGGSAFRAMAGFGRHHRLHEDHFFELAGSLTVEVEFIVNDAERQALLDLVRREKIRVFYAEIPARFGVINPDAGDCTAPPSVEKAP
jgi:PII-like signaling protein